MEFHEKLQELRKRKGLTQEELAQELCVSRTAVSKWESGRGYPNIDSLKAMAKFFAVTIDELLSGDEVLSIAEEEHQRQERRMIDLLFGLLDCSIAMFLFLPLFGQKSSDVIYEVSLLTLTEITAYMRTAYLLVVMAMIVCGVCTLALQNCRRAFWVRNKNRISLALNAAAVLLFSISLQPYAAAFSFVFLVIKGSMLLKKQ